MLAVLLFAVIVAYLVAQYFNNGVVGLGCFFMIIILVPIVLIIQLSPGLMFLLGIGVIIYSVVFGTKKSPQKRYSKENHQHLINHTDDDSIKSNLSNLDKNNVQEIFEFLPTQVPKKYIIKGLMSIKEGRFDQFVYELKKENLSELEILDIRIAVKRQYRESGLQLIEKPYMLNKSSNVLHLSNCRYVKNSNREGFIKYKSIDDIENIPYKKCSVCLGQNNTT